MKLPFGFELVTQKLATTAVQASTVPADGFVYERIRRFGLVQWLVRNRAYEWSLTFVNRRKIRQRYHGVLDAWMTPRAPGTAPRPSRLLVP